MGKTVQIGEFTENRESFIGTVERSESPCNCEMCQKGNESLGREVDKWHIVIAPLSVYQKNQHNWLSGKSVRSQKYTFMQALSKAGIKIEDTEDLTGRTFLFDDVFTGKNKETGKTYGVWVINRELSKKEVGEAMGFKPKDVKV